MTPSLEFDALGFAFGVAGPSWLRDAASTLFEPFATGSAGAAPGYTVSPGHDDANELALRLADEPVSTRTDRAAVVMALAHDVNFRALDGCPELAVHAGGVVWGNDAVVLPGVMEAGKSTLTAGLVRSGFGYLSDEAVLLDHESLLAKPYPKPISLDPGAWPLFPELRPGVELLKDACTDQQRQVPATALRPDCLAAASSVGLIVFPRFKRGARTTLSQITRGEALLELARNTFNLEQDGPAKLDALADFVRNADCYRLEIGGLDSAVQLVRTLVGRT